MDSSGRPLILAHRGASRYAPENTMSAFRRAVEMKADGIEIDVHLTKDSKVVVTHDPVLGRTCNGTGKITELSLEELLELDFGSWFSKEFEGEKIPLFEEVLELISESKLLLNTEIKATPGYYSPAVVQETANMIKAFKLQNSIIISSFNHYVLKEMKLLLPEIKIAPLYTGLFTNIWSYAEEIGAEAIHPNFHDVDNVVAEGCKRHNIDVNVWTVDREEDIRQMARLGVNAIISNVPDIALKTVKGL